MPVFIKVFSAQNKKVVTSFKLENMKKIIIGRNSLCDIQVKDGNCSGEHCSLKLVKNNIVLKDLNSKNGTSVNGHSITNSYVYVNDTIYIGNSSFSLDTDKLTAAEKVIFTNENDSNLTLPELKSIRSKDKSFDPTCLVKGAARRSGFNELTGVSVVKKVKRLSQVLKNRKK